VFFCFFGYSTRSCLPSRRDGGTGIVLYDTNRPIVEPRKEANSRCPAACEDIVVSAINVVWPKLMHKFAFAVDHDTTARL